MSFLANLRQQHSEKQNTCLCYLLSYEAVSSRLQLSLGFYDGTQAPIHSLKPYTLQREHLHTPPGFFSKKDLSLLKELVQLDVDCLDNHQVVIPPSINWMLLSRIISTEHCYFKHHSSAHNLKPIKVGSPRLAQGYWHLDPSTDYKLHWHLPEYTSARCVPLQRELLYFQTNATDVVLGCTSNALDQAGDRDYWQLHQLRIPLTAVISKPGAIDKLPLPLPSPPVVKTSTGQLRAILCCEPGIDGTDLVQLKFTIIDSNKYCSMPRNLTDTADFTESYWDGKALHELNIELTQYDHIKSTVCALLDSFIANDGLINYNNPTNNIFLNDTWQPQSESQWQALLVGHYDQWHDLGVGFAFHKQFKHHYIRSETWQIQLNDATGESLRLGITLCPQQVQESAIPLQSILAELREYNLQNQQGDCQLLLKDGRILLLPERESKGLMEELEGLEFTADGFYLDRAQSYRLADLQTTLEGQVEWHGDLATLEQAIAVNESPAVLDSHFAAVKAKLRPYQWLGVCWIHHLKKHGYNGLLADDMGLGKTLQVITMLAFEQQQQSLTKPALVVMPLSLIHNWVSEIEKFAPQLKTHVMHGNKRHKQWPSLVTFDILISTYQSVCLDLDKWKKQRLSWLILDEAQQIKNPSTRWSQALREIPCDNRLCLSGTPVENHLGELWSIMDFLMPGCLGRQKQFRSYYRKAIEVEGNNERMAQLLHRVAPFMLRRTKDQIAKDLPQKTDIVRHIELDQSQRRFYEEIKSDAWLELQTTLEQSDREGQNSIAALTALLKLRQVCCDPALLSATTVPSAKKNACIEMIDELVAEGRSVLVFSQFTKMLALLKEALEEKNIPSLTLTGSSRKREEIVAAFQQGEAPVFLISLKAGGIGLNLTRADTVIHYDPWWNAAAENQASDRAHRIGQDKPVFVYKLIAADTIEEKVEHLQEQKATLSKHVDQQAQLNADTFSLKFEELLALFHEENQE